MTLFPVPKVNAEVALVRSARALMLLGGGLMSAALGIVIWFLVVRPDVGFGFGVGPEIYAFVLGVGLRSRRRWAYARSRKALRWILILGAVGIPWNLGLGLAVGNEPIAIGGSVACGLVLVAGLELRRFLPAVDPAGPGWVEDESLPRWSRVLIGGYVVLMLAGVGSLVAGVLS